MNIFGCADLISNVQARTLPSIQVSEGMQRYIQGSKPTYGIIAQLFSTALIYTCQTGGKITPHI